MGANRGKMTKEDFERTVGRKVLERSNKAGHIRVGYQPASRICAVCGGNGGTSSYRSHYGDCPMDPANRRNLNSGPGSTND